MGSDPQYADEKAYGFYNEAEVYEGVDAAINKLADKVEDLPLVDKLADKIENNPKAMDALNKLASMYGGSMNEAFGGLDLSTIVKKSQEFSDKVAEGNANAAVAGIFGGPLLVSLLNLVPGAMETLMQAVNSPLGIDASYYEPAFLLSVAGGVLVGAIIDKIKNSLSETEDMYEEEDLDEMLVRLSEAEEEDELDIDVDTEEETDGGEEKSTNDSIVIDKKIVSLSSLPGETRKILDTLETLRAQAEEFGDQKFMTQVGNTITFFTRDFVVAGDEPTRAKVDESLNEDLASALTALIISIIAIPAIPITGALLMGLIDYLFNDLPDQRAEARSLRSYKGPDKQEKVLALAKEIESKLSPGKKRYLKTLVNRIGAAKLEDKAREYRELDRYAQSQKLDENLTTDIEAALKDLPIPSNEMEEGKDDKRSSMNESVTFPMWNKIK
jgi:hypothetical protein